jgi:hypothetical protein
MKVRLDFRWMVAAGLAVCMLVCSGCTGGSNGTSSDGGDGAAPVSDGGVDEPREGDGWVAADAAATSPDADEGGCHPMSVAGFQPSALVPTRPSLACNGFNGDGGLVQSYGDSCIGHSRTFGACAAVAIPDAAGAAACYGCLVTPESPDASPYGAAVIVTIPFVNYGGCIQAVDPTEAGVSCAQTLSAAATCADYACRQACPVTDDSSYNAYVACWNEATSGACSGYWLPAEGCMLTEQGDGGTDVARICFGGATTEDDYLSLAHYFCGGNWRPGHWP